MKGSTVGMIVIAMLLLAALIALAYQYRKADKITQKVKDWNKNKIDVEKKKRVEVINEIEVIDAEIIRLEDLQKNAGNGAKKKMDAWRANDDAERAAEFFTKRYGDGKDSTGDGQ